MRFSDQEMAAVTAAASRAGVAPAAYVAEKAVAVARGELAPLPADERERLRVLLVTREQLQQIGATLDRIAATSSSPSSATENLAATLEQTVRRLDETVAELLRRQEGR
ncbi:hypothetical protein Acsp04_63900 [Actinomadura sp. NBRC 104425]|uniref:hypothetical protein n=1 Tax=Actinomadura sp. NBRC 104425 TaxID=3032204 RepID=UPI0024A5C259|nr:hypothetical protein [Actinomadura sp. NBRC 104425]GLZ16155.1 hypothetical protein Acsp04_63900 [Actinomadura sp. NBRC 104425]